MNQVIDQRPAQRDRLTHALAEAERRLGNLIEAIESGAAARSLLEAMRGREAEIARLRSELASLEEPDDQKLAIMPGWVRRQLEDVAGLLSQSPERVKSEFRRLGVEFVLHPMEEANGRKFFRAVGLTSVAEALAGAKRTDFSTSALTDLR